MLQDRDLPEWVRFSPLALGPFHRAFLCNPTLRRLREEMAEIDGFVTANVDPDGLNDGRPRRGPAAHFSRNPAASARCLLSNDVVWIRGGVHVGPLRIDPIRLAAQVWRIEEFGLVIPEEVFRQAHLEGVDPNILADLLPRVMTEDEIRDAYEGVRSVAPPCGDPE